MDFEQAREPFLKSDKEDTESIIESSTEPHRRRRTFKFEIITHLVLIAIYTGVSIWLLRSQKSSIGDAPKNGMAEFLSTTGKTEKRRIES